MEKQNSVTFKHKKILLKTALWRKWWNNTFLPQSYWGKKILMFNIYDERDSGLISLSCY